MTPEQRKILADLEARTEVAMAAGDSEALAHIRAEAQNEVVKAGGASYETLQNMADLLERGITREIMAIIVTARRMGSDVVPVSFLQLVADNPKGTVAQFWAELTEVDGLIDFGVPDDLSGLEGL